MSTNDEARLAPISYFDIEGGDVVPFFNLAVEDYQVDVETEAGSTIKVRLVLEGDAQVSATLASVNSPNEAVTLYAGTDGFGYGGYDDEDDEEEEDDEEGTVLFVVDVAPYFPDQALLTLTVTNEESERFVFTFQISALDPNVD